MVINNLLDDKYVIDREIDVLVSMSNYLIKESYYNEYILEDGENENTDNNQNKSFFDKVKGLLVRIWTAISGAFKKLADKIRSLFKKNGGCKKSDPPEGADMNPTPIDPNAENAELPTNQMNDAQTRVNQMEADRNIQALEAQNQLLQQQVQQLAADQQKKDEDFQKLMNGQQQLQQELQAANSKIQQLTNNVEAGNNFTDQQIQQLQYDLTASNRTIIQLNQQIEQVNRDLADAQLDNMNDMQRLQQEKDQLEQQLQQAQQQQQQTNEMLQNSVNKLNSNQVTDHAYFDQLCQDVNNFAQIAIQRANQAASQTEQLATTVNAQAQTYAQAQNLVNTAMMDRANNDARMSQLESCQLNLNKAIEALEQKSTTDVTQLNALKQQTESMINQLQGAITSLDQKVNNTLTGFNQKLQSVENNIVSRFNQQQQTQPQPTQQPVQPNQPQPQPVQQQNPQQPTQQPVQPNQPQPQPVQQQPVQQNVNTQDNSQKGILDKLKQSAANLNNTLASINQSIFNATNVSDIKTKVVNMIDKAGDNIADTAKNLANTAVDKIDKAGDVIANTATNIGTNIVNGVKNMQQASNGHTITKYEDIPDYLKRRFQYIKFYLENSVLKNGRGISTPVIYAYNIPANLFENFNAIFTGMNSMVSGIGKLLSSAKINTNLNSNNDATTASNKTIVAAKNQIGQAISIMTAALKTQNAMVLDAKEFDTRFDQFDKSLDAIGNSSKEINKLLPVILNAQENNNDPNNQNKNRINNLLKLSLDGSNYFLKSYQQLNSFYEQTLDKYLSDENKLQNFYLKNNNP